MQLSDEKLQEIRIEARELADSLEADIVSFKMIDPQLGDGAVDKLAALLLSHAELREALENIRANAEGSAEVSKDLKEGSWVEFECIRKIAESALASPHSKASHSGENGQ